MTRFTVLVIYATPDGPVSDAVSVYARHPHSALHKALTQALKGLPRGWRLTTLSLPETA